MKKIAAFLMALFLMLSHSICVYAGEYIVNPFYAVESYGEYEKIKDSLGDSNHIYYGWSRIARNPDDSMVFTNKKTNISIYDYNPEYGLPPSVDGKLTNEIHKGIYPNSKNLLMVFFNKVDYQDKKNSAVEFLNMSSSEWDKNIIVPMIDMVNRYNFDGVVLDLEGFIDSYKGDGYTIEQKSNLKIKYNNFINQLRTRLENKLLEVCVNVPGFYDGYDYSYIYSKADYMILLTYPFAHYIRYQDSDGVPGLTGKIKTIDIPEPQPYEKTKTELDALNNILKQAYREKYSPKKLILGTTIELNGWIQKEFLYHSKPYTYYEGLASLPDASRFKASKLADLEQIQGVVDYINASKEYLYQSKTYRKTVSVNLEPGMKKIEYYYDTPESIYDKYYSLANDFNLAGISIWRIGLGCTSTWKGINSLFNMQDGNYTELPAKQDIQQDKVWTIKFNGPVDKLSVKQSLKNISVVDSEGTEMSVRLQYDEASNTVKVIPVNNYKAGQVYFLIVGKDIKSVEGGPLESPVRMKFKIRQ